MPHQQQRRAAIVLYACVISCKRAQVFILRQQRRGDRQAVRGRQHALVFLAGRYQQSRQSNMLRALRPRLRDRPSSIRNFLAMLAQKRPHAR